MTAWNFLSLSIVPGSTFDTGLARRPDSQLKQKARGEIFGDEANWLFQGSILQHAVELQIRRDEDSDAPLDVCCHTIRLVLVSWT